MSDQILLADLSTKSVTLTPLRATVTRDIHACIKPNQTDLTIVGLDPRVDTNSIRIQGSGPATITDIQTGVVPRTDESPDLSDSESSSSSDESDDDDPNEGDSEALRKIEAEIAPLEASLARARALKRVGPSVMNMLDEYGRRLAPETAGSEQVGRFLALYEEQALRCVERHCEGEAAEGTAERELMRLKGRRERVRRGMLRGRVSAGREKKKRRAKKESLRAQKARERAFRAEKKRAFWTEWVRKVVVSLDRHVVPLRSRASSTTTTTTSTTTATDKVEKDLDISLQLSYVVELAKWSPRYELSIDTPKSTARLTYRAEFVNATSETWKDAHVTLSTSQAAFSRLDEPLPALVPWQVKLHETASDASSNHKHPSWDRMLRSSAEDPFNVNSGLRNPFPHPSSMARQGQQQMLASQSQQQTQQQAQQMFRLQAQQQAQQAQKQASGKAPAATGGLFSSAPPAAPRGSGGGSLFGMSGSGATIPATSVIASVAAPPADTVPSPTAQSATEPNTLDAPDDSSTLDHQDSIKNDFGLTTTYDLPGRRTLAPSSIPRRHVLADLELKNVKLSHLVVPKHRAAAFLRARIQNTSAVTLLRGPVGMAVDATFLGTSSVPPTTPGEYFGVSMGIDPDVVVRYSPPKVQRLGASSVFFAKDEMALFTRVCVLKNAKPTAVEVTLLEQVPVSEDERLKVRVVTPSGLEKEGDRATVEMETSSGSGGVSLGKNGEVRFVVTLRPGKEVKLVLEYEASAPSGSEVGN